MNSLKFPPLVPLKNKYIIKLQPVKLQPVF